MESALRAFVLPLPQLLLKASENAPQILEVVDPEIPRTKQELQSLLDCPSTEQDSAPWPEVQGPSANTSELYAAC